MTSFDALLAEGESVPTEGWDFTWFAGRATETRPPWGYSRLLARRLAGTQGVLDLQTGGGEVLAEALTSAEHTPELLRATESWPPNLALASRALAPWGGEVMEVAAVVAFLRKVIWIVPGCTVGSSPRDRSRPPRSGS